jgi:hypothetical protein
MQVKKSALTFYTCLPRQVEKHGTDELYVKSVLPEDGDGASPRNVVFKRIDAAVRPRRLY